MSGGDFVLSKIGGVLSWGGFCPGGLLSWTRPSRIWHAPKRNEKFAYCGLDFSIAPVNKLVSDDVAVCGAQKSSKFCIYIENFIRRNGEGVFGVDLKIMFADGTLALDRPARKRGRSISVHQTQQVQDRSV